MSKSVRKFYFFASTGAHNRPHFRRCGLVFYNDRGRPQWRPIELGDADNLEADPPIVGPATFGLLEAETKGRTLPKAERAYGSDGQAPAMLIMRPATTEEVRLHLEEKKALEPRDPVKSLEEENAKLRERTSDLEARLMKLEVNQQAATKGGRS